MAPAENHADGGANPPREHKSEIWAKIKLPDEKVRIPIAN